jgi:gliding motility-associated-like protein
VNFTIVASNANSYQWQGFINNVWQPLPAGTDYSGVTTSQLTIINAGNTNIERFRCIVSNAHGNATSSTGLVTTNSPALITTQPAPVNTCTNTPFVLNAKVNSSLAVQYQWQQLQNISWTNIAGATEASVTSVTGNTETEHSYRMIAENSCGADTSSVAKVSVINCNIPNAFSPNDDGVNDVWRMSFPSQYRVHIFNRNGMNVYKGNHQGVFSWRGLANGKALPDGVYYYHVTAPGYKTLSGSLTLLR